MKLVADNEIPFLQGLFDPYMDVVCKPGEQICADDLKDADVLLISIRTKCTAEMLKGSPVKLIATANIGTDHIDMDYCNAHGIRVENAKGCNAGGVMNYVMSALFGIASRKSIPLYGATIGIIGAGNCGSLVEAAARLLGFNVLLCDPPRAEVEGEEGFCSQQFLLNNSDIVSMHVPLNSSTAKMANAEFFSQMKLGAFFINVARGEVVDEEALIEAIPKLGPVVLDTWQGEPEVNRRLMNLVDIATPHVAGYSLQGKAYGTAYAVRAVAHFAGIKKLMEYMPQVDESQRAVKIEIEGRTQGEIASSIQYNYPIFTDDFMFRVNPNGFNQLRSEYKYRREFYFE